MTPFFVSVNDKVNYPDVRDLSSFDVPGLHFSADFKDQVLEKGPNLKENVTIWLLESKI